ncbi:hypothetical protein AURDEDRAFT_123660 [Auricularia subglabra TFB-10046 SS5]|nr:hypothetical protein AURDEDRAFT_123660 [Auricularia subglabra TFB-10046 SS5]
MDGYPTLSPSEESFQSPLFRDGRLPEACDADFFIDAGGSHNSYLKMLDNFQWAPLDSIPDPPRTPPDRDAPPTSYPPRKQSVPYSVTGDDEELDTADCVNDKYCITFFQETASIDSPAFPSPDLTYQFPQTEPARRPSHALRSTPPAHRSYDTVDTVDYLPVSSKADVFPTPLGLAETQPLQIRRRRNLSIASRSPPPPSPPPKDTHWSRPRVLTNVEAPWNNTTVDPALFQATLAAGRQSRTLRQEHTLRAAASSPALNRAKSYPPRAAAGENATLADLIGPTPGRKLFKRRHPHSAGFLAPSHSLTNSIGTFMHEAFHTPISLPRRPEPRHGQSFDNTFDD